MTDQESRTKQHIISKVDLNMCPQIPVLFRYPWNVQEIQVSLQNRNKIVQTKSFDYNAIDEKLKSENKRAIPAEN